MSLGLNIKINKRIFSVDEGINWQGEGCSLDIFTFETPFENESIFKSSYLIEMPNRDGWEIMRWESTPFDEEQIYGLKLSSNGKLLDKKSN